MTNELSQRDDSEPLEKEKLEVDPSQPPEPPRTQGQASAPGGRRRPVGRGRADRADAAARALPTAPEADETEAGPLGRPRKRDRFGASAKQGWESIRLGRAVELERSWRSNLARILNPGDQSTTLIS